MKRLLLVLLLGVAACATDPAAPEADASPRSPASVERRAVVPTDAAVPDGMAYVPGGTTTIGVTPDEAGLPHERPAFAAEVAPFALDRSPVTVDRFRAFTEATGHETTAERFGDGGVLDAGAGQWTLVPGATWRHPEGPRGPDPPADHPVTQVSYDDAEAFCEWDGGRLPTEIEWEHAARGAVDRRAPYAWGDRLDGGPADAAPEAAGYGANTWTGTFPSRNTAADGYLATSPVGAFGATDLGLTDLGGNVWEWTASWFRPYADVAADAPFEPGPEAERVQRGGSFLCHASYCHGYRVSARSHSSPETSLFHVGFRCARDLAS